MSETIAASMRETFHRQFGGAPQVVVCAPGRVNLIGEHTDYNEGFVMPLAIDRAVWIAARLRADGQVALYSENFHGREQFSLTHVEKATGDGAWSNYVRGVAAVLQEAGYGLRGMDAALWGDVPVGAGLSSSAAVEVASAFTFASLAGLSIAPLDLARLAQRAEVEFVGVNCGIMDQMISTLGQAGHALLIDCRSLAHRAVPVPDEVAIVVADTMKRRELVDSKYNERRGECEAGARLLGVKSLRDVTVEEFEQKQSSLPAVIRRRCRHVIGENRRVLQCVEQLASGAAGETGRLLYQSHDSLRDDYEVSCYELDVMVETASRQPGILGARMTGAGFGGCTVNLVEASAAESFARQLAEQYNRQTGLAPSVYVCRAAAGVAVYR